MNSVSAIIAIIDTHDFQLEDITDPESRLIVLQSELTKYIASSDESTSLEEIKSNYSTEIKTAFMSAKVLSAFSPRLLPVIIAAAELVEESFLDMIPFYELYQAVLDGAATTPSSALEETNPVEVFTLRKGKHIIHQHSKRWS